MMNEYLQFERGIVPSSLVVNGLLSPPPPLATFLVTLVPLVGLTCTPLITGKSDDESVVNKCGCGCSFGSLKLTGAPKSDEGLCLEEGGDAR